MAERPGIGVIPGVGWSAAEVQEVAREAEDAGFDAIFAAEVNKDVMATAQLMETATKRISVGTWIANIYLRFKGEGPATHLPQRPSSKPVPIYVAAITPRTIELAGEIADGLMPFLWSGDRIKQAKCWIDRGRAKSSGLGKKCKENLEAYRNAGIELPILVPSIGTDSARALIRDFHP